MVPISSGTKINRSELLRNVNRFLKTDYSSMSDLSDGVAFAQILHACLPDHLPLCKVNFNVKNKLQALKNLSIVEQTLRSSDLLKTCPKHKIAARSSLEIYQFLRWCWTLMTNNYSHVVVPYRADEWRNAIQQSTTEKLEHPDLGLDSSENNFNSETGRLCKELEDDIISRMSSLKTSLTELNKLRSYNDLLRHDVAKLRAACEEHARHPLAVRLLACIRPQTSETRIIKTIG